MEELLNKLTLTQVNILIASIMADGEITKIYPGSRRKNNSYREHFSINQLAYREWKATMLPQLLYLRSSMDYLVSKSNPLFTKLYPHFYNNEGRKKLPDELLPLCTLPEFIAVLYLDDGSLCISRRINGRKKHIYLTPHICLYLQSYLKDDLEILQKHINENFNISFSLSKRNDGYGYILKLTKVNDSTRFLKLIENAAEECSLDYKTNWIKRFEIEKEQLQSQYPDFKILSSDSERWKNYTEQEVKTIITLKMADQTDKAIAQQLNRSYWSIVYKIRELRKDGRLE